MNTVLVILACLGGRWCANTPLYVVKYETQAACEVAMNQEKQKNSAVVAKCVPEIKK